MTSWRGVGAGRGVTHVFVVPGALPLRETRHHQALYADQQQVGGVTKQAVYQAEDDPNSVLVFHQFSTSEQAHAFFANPELRQVMQQAGVDEATLRVEFFHEA